VGAIERRRQELARSLAREPGSIGGQLRPLRGLRSLGL